MQFQRRGGSLHREPWPPTASAASSHSHAMPTADEKALTGDPARLLRGEKENHVGDVSWLAKTAQWDGCLDLRHLIFRNPAGLDRPWSDDVDGDPIFGELDRGGATVGLERGFARAIRDLTRER